MGLSDRGMDPCEKFGVRKGLDLEKRRVDQSRRTLIKGSNIVVRVKVSSVRYSEF